MAKKKAEDQETTEPVDGMNRLVVHGMEGNDMHTLSRVMFNGDSLCFSMEDALSKTGIPNGEYNIGLLEEFTPRWYRDQKGNITHVDDLTSSEGLIPAELIEIQNVPDFDEVFFSWGNVASDCSGGTILVGEKPGFMKGKRAVTSSRKTYQRIYPILWKAAKSGHFKVMFMR